MMEQPKPTTKHAVGTTVEESIIYSDSKYFKAGMNFLKEGDQYRCSYGRCV